MPHWTPQNTDNLSDAEYQDYILQGVSRTFALTIPQLPHALRQVVGNAYLLCRICDTIEDEPAIHIDAKSRFSDELVQVIKGQYSAEVFAETFSSLLTQQTPPAEHDLIKNTSRIIRLTHSFSPTQQKAIEVCVNEMGKGMTQFQREQSLHGLSDKNELAEYCYYVAGVVGILLTKLFCEYSSTIATHRDELLKLAVSFGQGLQMTNILKDIWEDHKRGACWLPRDVFSGCKFDLQVLPEHRDDNCFSEGMGELIALAMQHLQNALNYTLLIPTDEKGIRRFCFWALGMAVLTLRKIHKHRNFRSANQIKISRRSVKATIIATDFIVGGNRRPRMLFDMVASGLPQTNET